LALELSIFSLLYNATKDLVRFIFERFKKTPLEQVLAHRQKMKQEFETHLHWIDDTDKFGEVIIRDIRRMDSYPNIDEKAKGISPWFCVGMLDLYHKGLQVGLKYEGLKFDKEHNGWRYYNYGKEKEDLIALLLGKIPFDEIVEVDWEGDEYYSIPHIYCKFIQRKKEPYEDLIFVEEKKGTFRPFYSDICNYDDVIKLSKKLKTGHFA
jgi:hypothetical protein